MACSTVFMAVAANRNVTLLVLLRDLLLDWADLREKARDKQGVWRWGL